MHYILGNSYTFLSYGASGVSDIIHPPFSPSDSPTQTFQPSDTSMLKPSVSTRQSIPRGLCRSLSMSTALAITGHHESVLVTTLPPKEGAIRALAIVCQVKMSQGENIIGQNVTRSERLGGAVTRTKRQVHTAGFSVNVGRV